MSQYHFWWARKNIEHIVDYVVEPYEAKEAIGDEPFIAKAGQDKYVAYGQSDAGRYLLVVFAPKSERRLRVITARDMTAAEKKRYRRRRR